MHGAEDKRESRSREMFKGIKESERALSTLQQDRNGMRQWLIRVRDVAADPSGYVMFPEGRVDRLLHTVVRESIATTYARAPLIHHNGDCHSLKHSQRKTKLTSQIQSQIHFQGGIRFPEGQDVGPRGGGLAYVYPQSVLQQPVAHQREVVTLCEE